MFQDRHGFLWFGTQDGLNRYDGYSFTIYRNSAANPFSLPNNSIAGIAEDRSGLLWIATTGGGLASFDRATERFTRYQTDPKNPASLSDNATSFLYRDRSERMWVGTQFGGLNVFDPGKREFRRYRHSAADPGSLASDDVTAILEDRAGTFWVATRNAGLDRFDPVTRRFTHFRHDPADANSLNHNAVHGMYEDRQGRLWVGTERGAAQLDRNTGKFLRFRNHPSQRASSPVDPPTFAFWEDAAGDSWIGTATGLERLDKQGRHTCYRQEGADERTLSSSTVRTILEDRSGTLWFGTEHGVNRHSAASRRFVTFRTGPGGLTNNVVKGIYEGPDGTVWVGTDLGLNRYHPATGTFTAYLHKEGDPASLPDNSVSGVAPGLGGTLWVSTPGGLSNLDPATGRFRTYRHSPTDPNSISHDRAGFIRSFDGGAVLWVGSRSGLNRMDVATGKFTRYLNDPVRPDSLANNEVRSFAADRDGTFWVGTRHAGLEHFDPRSGSFTHFPHEPSNPKSIGGPAVYGIAVDRKGRVWAGTTGGLSLLDRVTGTFTRFTEKDGLPNDTVYGVLEDANSYLWLSTNNGLARFDTDKRTFRSYNISHGLQDNEFNGGSAHYSPYSKMMYFGGVGGYNRFDPEAVKDSQFTPPVVLTWFQKLGVAMPQAIQAESVELSWRDPMFSVEFASLDYTAPDQNRYAYRLEGFDRAWQESRSRRVATYTNLDSGTYRFRVKGTNSDGVWSPNEASLRITIIPPPWKRWWFLLATALLVIGGVVWAYRARVARFREAQARQEAFSRLMIESQEAERKKIAAELHDSLGQNLIVIRNHALMALAKPADHENAARKLEEISATASEAIDEVREIARNLRPQQLERLGLTNSLNSLVTRAQAASSIRFMASIDPIDGLLSKENEINLYRVVQEAVNNILKHSQATEASVIVDKMDDAISLKIRDDGQGFDVRAQGGDRRGFGLTGIAERARILGARHAVETSPGQGTVILLEIDLRHGRPSSSHR